MPKARQLLSDRNQFSDIGLCGKISMILESHSFLCSNILYNIQPNERKVNEISLNNDRSLTPLSFVVIIPSKYFFAFSAYFDYNALQLITLKITYE